MQSSDRIYCITLNNLNSNCLNCCETYVPSAYHRILMFLFSGRYFQMFSCCPLKGTLNISTSPSRCSFIPVEAGEAEPHCHCCAWHGEGHSSVSGCSGSHSEWQSASAWAWCLYSVCRTGEHQAGAATSSGGEEPHCRFPTEEQIWRDAPYLYRGETSKLACHGHFQSFDP